MEFTALQIAEALQGTVEGDATTTVSTLSKIEEGKPGSLSFLANPAYEKYIYETHASIVIVNHDFKPEKEVSATLVRVKDAYMAFAQLLELYQQIQTNLELLLRGLLIQIQLILKHNICIKVLSLILCNHYHQTVLGLVIQLSLILLNQQNMPIQK